MEGSAGQWPYTLFTEARSVAPATAGLWVSIYWASVTVGFQITAVKLGLAAIPAAVGVLAEALGLEIIGPALFVIATIMFLLHEAIAPR